MLALLLAAALPLGAQEKFYSYYEKGQRYLETGDHLRALGEFRAAASLEFEDVKRKRTYGTRFIRYYPHLKMGFCHFHLGEGELARQELELHLAYRKKSKEARHLLDRIAAGDLPEVQERVILEEPEIAPAGESAKSELPPPDPGGTGPLESLLDEGSASTSSGEAAPLEAAPAESASPDKDSPGLFDWMSDRIQDVGEAISAQPDMTYVRSGGVLAYSPEAVTQVGSRLSLAVMPFQVTGESRDVGVHAAETLVTEFVNLRRFRVIERNAVDEILKEQAFNMSGMVDERQAVEVAKLVGADALVMGSITVTRGFARINARVIDTETSITLVARMAESRKSGIRNIDREVAKLAIEVYNDLPLLDGTVINLEAGEIFLDIGSGAGLRKGSKLVAYREGRPIVHPVTGEELGRRVTQLGELAVVQVQERMSIARTLGGKQQPLNVGDKVVTK